ncbi:DUF3892 domain-containing protein [Micromonospora sp. NPDC093277]|uniref:DUF3892 domain-containing protein n=1 Tax=Micromonospora sp. NPDC093277 TaxID=3364291 RepID=UPI0037F6E56D
MTAQLHFLAYVRQGLAAAGVAPDPIETDIPARAPVTVSVQLAHRNPHTFDVRLYGPGDIRGLDTRQIIRLDPPPGASDFEPNNLVTCEFDRPDFPWLFTPAAVGDRGRLRPWLFLVVVPVTDSTLHTDTGPLPVLHCDLSQLPDLAESWAWAHAQVATIDDKEPVATVLATDPNRTLSRLISPRRLSPGIAYRACLVPAFEAGRRAGLGLAVDEDTDLGPAWQVGSGPAPALPVYHHWEFSTGADGDFESLVRRLRPRALASDAGLRPMVLGRLGVPELDPTVPTVTLGAEGALRGATTMPTLWPAESREPVQRVLRDLIAGTGTRLGPPLYGGGYTNADRLPADTGLPRWLRELNLDPRHRVAAALGARVVRERQEELMAAAWEQAAAVQRANEALRQAQLAAEASRSTYERRIGPAPAGTRLSAGAPVLGGGRLLQVSAAVLGAVPVTPRSRRLVGGELDGNSTTSATLSTAYRRLARRHGPLARRIGPTTDLSTVVEATAANQITATPPPRPPDGTVLFDKVAGDSMSFTRINRQRINDAARWWARTGTAATGARLAAPAADAEPTPQAGGQTAGADVAVEAESPVVLPAQRSAEAEPVTAVPATVVAGTDGALSPHTSQPQTMRPRDDDWPPPDWDPDPDPDPKPTPTATELPPVPYPDGKPLPAGTPATLTGQPGTLLSPPSATPDGRRLYANTTDGQLFERYFDGTRWLWSDHGTPPNTRAASVEPGGFMDGGRRVFVASYSGRLFEHYWDTDRWLWREHPIPPNSYGLGSAPGLVLNNESLFVATTTNGTTNVGRLWERRRNGDSWTWIDHGNPGGSEQITDKPWAAHGNTRFFVQTMAGNLWARQWDGNRWWWVNHGYPSGAGVRGIGPALGTTSVFVQTYDGRLFQRQYDGTSWTWVDHGTPPGTRIANMTYEVLETATETALFIGATNGHLYQRRWNGSRWDWVDLGTPPGTTIMQPPGGVVTSPPTAFVTGSNGRLYSISKGTSGWVWTDHGAPLDSRGSGPAAAEPVADVRWALPLGFLSSMIAAHIDNGPTDNYIYHRVGRDIGFEGEIRGGWSDPVLKPGWTGWENQGLGIAVADINGNGRPDIIVLWVDNPAGANTICYQIGWNLNPNGQPTDGWSDVFRLPAQVAPEVQGADLAIADLDGDGRPELILAYVTAGATPTMYYRVGWRLDGTGQVTQGWSESVPVQWKAGPVQGVGVAVADLDNKQVPDLLLLTIEPSASGNKAIYRIGRRLNPRGQVVGGWTPVKTVGGPPLPAAHQGAGVAVMDVTGTNRADLVLFHLANPAGANHGYYRVGWDLDHYGDAKSWSADAEVTGWFGGEGQGAAVAVADLDPALTAIRTAMGDAFVAAAGPHQDKVLAAQALVRQHTPPPVDAAALADRVATALQPVAGITERTVAKLELPGPVDSLRQLVVVPQFPQPMYEALRDLSQELLFPGVAGIPAETVTLLRINASFVEAFMVGLNAELGREMLWRRYPTDPRATYFRQFWDVRSTTKPLPDVPPIGDWDPHQEIGGNLAAAAGGDMLVLLVRGELLRRYPGTDIYLQQASLGADGRRVPTGAVLTPRFAGRLRPDIQFFGMPLHVDDARGDDDRPGWFVVLRQPPTDARFGLDAPTEDTPYGGAPGRWDDLHWRHLAGSAADDKVLRHVPATGRLRSLSLGGLEWGRNAAHQAQIVLQRPVLVAVHASDMIPVVDDAWQVDAVDRRDDRIVALGGRRSDGTRWRMSSDEVIAALSRHEQFLVDQPTGHTVAVRVSRTAAGRPYLTTDADGEIPNNLLALPELAEDA